MLSTLAATQFYHSEKLQSTKTIHAKIRPPGGFIIAKNYRVLKPASYEGVGVRGFIIAKNYRVLKLLFVLI